MEAVDSPARPEFDLYMQNLMTHRVIRWLISRIVYSNGYILRDVEYGDGYSDSSCYLMIDF